MKIDKDIVIRHIAGERILIPIGKSALHNTGIITLTESGELLAERLKEDCTEEELVDCILREYDVDRTTAAKDVNAFLEKLRERQLLGD